MVLIEGSIVDMGRGVSMIIVNGSFAVNGVMIIVFIETRIYYTCNIIPAHMHSVY